MCNVEIKKLVNEINIISNIELNNIKEEVNLVIKNNIVNINTIESLFDRMLSLTFIEEDSLKPIYFKLLDYYKNINEEYSNEYRKFYIEQYGEEKVLKKIK